jgi:CobQ-like glutamine amidotransferase family enzyme
MLQIKKSISKFYITHLYPDKMSIYGDWGNILAISRRIQQYGLEPVYQPINEGQDLPETTDFYFMGGGQDKEQFEIFKDLIKKKKRLIKDVENGVPLLSICGGYQLFGQKFVTGQGLEMDGIGLFDVVTKAPNSNVKSRCVGNLIIDCLIPTLKGIKLVGFENHSGQTEFVSAQRCNPLGKVLFGFGNNIAKKYEGCVYKNAIGTYLHGSCLPKNPELTSHLVLESLRRKAEIGELDPADYISIRKSEQDDSIVSELKSSLIKRFVKKV